MKNIKYIRLFLLGIFCALISTHSKAEDARVFGTSSTILQAARAQIAVGDSETACSIYVWKVLRRAGYSVSPFTANEFGSTVKRSLPGWSVRAFYAGGDPGRAALRAFLNSRPDGSAFLAQWIRRGRSGHVAIVAKEGKNRFRIYQAQMGLARAHTKLTSIEGLLYSRNQYGDRSNLRLYLP